MSVPRAPSHADDLSSGQGRPRSASPTHRADPTEDEIRGALERATASSVLSGSPQLARFLQFVVEESVAGRGGQLKEYTIGVHALGRPNFDPASDSAVRVAARQLRFKLSEYYLGEGTGERVAIELPKGGYVPRFVVRAAGTAAAPARQPRRSWTGFAALGGAAILAVGVLAIAPLRSALLQRAKRSWAMATTESPQRELTSIVVLPFLNLSGDAAEDYVSDGVTEEVTAGLAGVPGLRVIARTSAFQFKGRPRDVRAIGRDLDVATVLEGSIRRSGDTYRVTSQLIETEGGAHLWSGSWDIEPRNLLTLQDTIARAVTASIRVRVGAPLHTPVRRTTGDSRAYALYLEARFHWNRRTPDALRLSLQLFEHAASLDSGFALAFAGVAALHATMAVNSISQPGVSEPLAIAAARTALRLDPSLGEAHATLGLLRAFRDRDWEGGDAEFARAIRLSPNHAMAHSWYGTTLLARGRFDDALVQLRYAERLDPLSMPIAYGIAETLYYARRWDAAVVAVQRVIDLDPDNPSAYSLLGKVQLQASRRAEARSSFARARDSFGLALVLDEPQRSTVLRRELRAMDAGQVSRSPYLLACLHAALGDRDEAFDWINRAYDAGQLDLVSMKVDPAMDPLRKDPRYTVMLHRIGLGPGQ